MIEDTKDKKYWVDKVVYSGVPGTDIYEALKQAFQDFYASDIRHEIELKLNGVTVTMKKDRY